jgi:hypothetical protein
LQLITKSLSLGLMHLITAKGHLPVQVAQLHPVVIRQHQLPDTGARQI